MKRLSTLLILLFATTVLKAQVGQVIVASYDDTGQIVYLCDGHVQNSVPVQVAMINLNQNVTVTVDSVVPQGDPADFKDVKTDTTRFMLGEEEGTYGLFYPSQVGEDTFHVTVYFNGQYAATASIIFHARSSPDLSMYGYVLTTADSVAGYSFGELNTEEVTDTMFDLMQAGIDPWYYYTGAPTTENGGSMNEQVELRSCGGAVIDSINEVGDFSEFVFDSLPSLPDTLHDGASLILNYEFSPKFVDTLRAHPHYLVFHSTDGHYLTWSFRYGVFPTSSVSPIAASDDGLRIFPNPATNDLQVLGGPLGTARLFDLLGREVLETKDDGSGAQLDISHLEAGVYFLRIGNQSAKVDIEH